MADWKIRRKQGECTGCERPFEDGERHASLLRAGEEGLSREDLCTGCWDAHAPDDATLFWWFTRFIANRKRSLNLDLASLERLFTELDGREEGKLREIRYLLCLLLMRKRRLRLERVQRGRAGEALIVRRPRRKEELVVHVFDFSSERIDTLRGDLLEILDGAGPTEEDADGAPAAGSKPDAGSQAGEAAEAPEASEEQAAEPTPAPDGDPAPADAGSALPAK